MTAGIILFAHGSRDREWARPFEALAANLSRKVDGPVRLAYLELMQPSLEHAIGSLAADGIKQIRIVPVFFGPGGHIKHDLPRLAASACKKHPHLKVEVDAPIGEQAAVLEAIARAIAEKTVTR